MRLFYFRLKHETTQTEKGNDKEHPVHSKKFELMLTRRAKAYSSSGSVV